MEYTTQLAQPFIGKRVIVSLRHIDAKGKETFSGLWGVIDSVHEDGLLLKVEGGIEDEFWAFPPDLEALTPAKHECYQLDSFDKPVVNVDFEAYFSMAESPEHLK
jgi:hypothetical protein